MRRSKPSAWLEEKKTKGEKRRRTEIQLKCPGSKPGADRGKKTSKTFVKSVKKAVGEYSTRRRRNAREGEKMMPTGCERRKQERDEKGKRILQASPKDPTRRYAGGRREALSVGDRGGRSRKKKSTTMPREKASCTQERKKDDSPHGECTSIILLHEKRGYIITNRKEKNPGGEKKEHYLIPIVGVCNSRSGYDSWPKGYLS